ncbi:WhiB family transcriptional regulator [Gordonia insulae]|uniref:Transcriptional regulator WhiB n=1 Tax=Gordonia insulae TaxID=2420509 RepID=A0A3G8JJW5_9ACTN|nr:hypothetical protein [Gordonia insulae]AZG44822.1 Transcriptional regulator WhiB [Gordonia insulae]
MTEPIRTRQSWREPAEHPIVGLTSALAGLPRLPGAACRGWPEIFDAEAPADPRAPEALELCAGCPALQLCTAWVDALTPAQRPAGVVAGRLPPTPPKKPLRVPSPTTAENIAVRGRHGRNTPPKEITA